MMVEVKKAVSLILCSQTLFIPEVFVSILIPLTFSLSFLKDFKFGIKVSIA